MRWQFFGALAAGLIYGVSTGAGLPLVAKQLLPKLGTEVEFWEVMGVALILPIAFLVRGLAGFLNTYGMAYCGQRVLEALRLDVFAHLQRLSLSFFEQRRSGDLVSRLIGDTQAIRVGIVNVANDLIKQPTVLIAAISSIIYMSIQQREAFFLLIYLLSVGLCVFPIRFLAKKLKRRAKRLQAQVGDVSAYLTDSLQAPREIRAFNLQDDQVEGLRTHVGKILKWQMKVLKYEKALAPTIELVAATGMVAIIYYSWKAGIGFAEIGALLLALFLCYEPVKRIGALITRFKSMEASLDRIEEISQLEPEVEDPADPEDLGTVAGEVRFDNVTFAYDEEPILRGVDLTVSPGEVVGIVGPSGAGKTTFINLLLRFYDVSSGAVRIDGHDVRKVRQAQLREAISFVPQEPLMFNATARENILMGRPGASDEEVIEAARKARAHEFIMAMEEGYDTVLGEKGTRLSGGQRQRIALSRAFLRGSPILVLDEATSALDSENETQVQEALAQLIKGKTVFIIAHRFSTLGIVNRILVLNEGQVVGDGSHEELQETCPLYRELRDLQMYK